MVDYTKAEAEKLMMRITEEMPKAVVHNWRDFGFSVDVALGDRVCVACQPDTDYQAGCFHDIATIKRLLTAH